MAAARWALGTSALVITVPAAEPVVGPWRLQYDPSAAAGMPAHVTVLYPWLAASAIDDHVLARLDSLVRREPAFGLRLAEPARFPDTLYLRPEPDAPFRRLTAAVTASWPDRPPYGGAYADVVPHLTVAGHQAAAVLDDVEAALVPFDVVDTRIDAVELYVFDGSAWRPRHRSPLGPG
jgi:2'-5' RNA ligase